MGLVSFTVMSFTIIRFHCIFMYTFIHVCTYPFLVYVSLLHICNLNTIKYYTAQVTNLYTDASDSQDNHTEVYNIIRMQMTPKIITIRYTRL